MSCYIVWCYVTLYFLCRIVLHCPVLCCVVLHCAMRCYSGSCYTPTYCCYTTRLPRYGMLCFIVLYYAFLYDAGATPCYAILYCTKPCFTIASCIILHHAMPYCLALRCATVTPCRIIWYHSVLYHVVLQRAVLQDFVLYHCMLHCCAALIR